MDCRKFIKVTGAKARALPALMAEHGNRYFGMACKTCATPFPTRLLAENNFGTGGD